MALAALGGILTAATLSVAGPGALVLIPVAALGAAAFQRPQWIPMVVVAGCAVYLGIYLTYRLRFGAFPLSALDLMAPLLLAAACSLRAHSQSGRPRSAGLWIPVALLATGLAMGSIVGVANGAEPYDLLRIDSIELSLLIGAIAGVVAGRTLSWQHAISTAFYVAAALAALQQILSFAYLTGTGTSMWEAFPFGADIASVDTALAQSAVAGTRDNYLATFIMLPALSLCVYRFRSSDVVFSAVLVLAVAVSLSRTMWLASAITIVIAMLARAWPNAGPRGASVLKLGVVALCVAVVLSNVGSELFGARVGEVGDRSDPSLKYRQLETASAAEALFDSPVSAVAGTGAGVVLTPSAAIILQDSFRGRTNRQPTSAVENQLLGRWRNFGVISLLGAAALLLGAGFGAFRALVKRRHAVNETLMALGLALPSVLAVSPVGGTLLQVNVSLPFWLLAGAVLAALGQQRGPAQPASSIGPRPSRMHGGARRDHRVESPPSRADVVPDLPGIQSSTG